MIVCEVGICQRGRTWSARRLRLIILGPTTKWDGVRRIFGVDFLASLGSKTRIRCFFDLYEIVSVYREARAQKQTRTDTLGLASCTDQVKFNEYG